MVFSGQNWWFHEYAKAIANYWSVPELVFWASSGLGSIIVFLIFFVKNILIYLLYKYFIKIKFGLMV